ncbi:MAG: hypothetical protein SGPRY_010727 [Prymnesium sp.]
MRQETLLKELQKAEDELAEQRERACQLQAQGKAKAEELQAASLHFYALECALQEARAKAKIEAYKQMAVLVERHAAMANTSTAPGPTTQESLQEEEDKYYHLKLDRIEHLVTKIDRNVTEVRKDVTSVKNDVKQMRIIVNHWVSNEVEIYFLCAYRLEPVHPPIKIDVLEDNVKQALRVMAPAIKFSLHAIKILLTLPIDLAPLDGFLRERFDFGTDNMESLKQQLDQTVQAATGDTDADSLDTLNEVIKAIEADDLDANQCKEIEKTKELSGPAFRAVATLAEEQGVISQLPMKKMMAIDGTVAWVHVQNAEKWARSGRFWTEVSINGTPSNKNRKALATQHEGHVSELHSRDQAHSLRLSQVRAEEIYMNSAPAA